LSNSKAGCGLVKGAIGEAQHKTRAEEEPMNTKESFCNSTCEDEMRTAERELAAFISAVTELFGPAQARLAANDWLDESERIDSPLRPTNRDWRAVTVAASAQLANRLTVARQHRTPLVASVDTKVLPIPSSDCFSSTVLV
jgi:hypothetical protein